MAHYMLTQDKRNGDVILRAVERDEPKPKYVKNGKILMIRNKDGKLCRYPNVNPELGFVLEEVNGVPGYVAFTE